VSLYGDTVPLGRKVSDIISMHKFILWYCGLVSKVHTDSL